MLRSFKSPLEKPCSASSRIVHLAGGPRNGERHSVAGSAHLHATLPGRVEGHVELAAPDRQDGSALLARPCRIATRPAGPQRPPGVLRPVRQAAGIQTCRFLSASEFLFQVLPRATEVLITETLEGIARHHAIDLGFGLRFRRPSGCAHQKKDTDDKCKSTCQHGIAPRKSVRRHSNRSEGGRGYGESSSCRFSGLLGNCLAKWRSGPHRRSKPAWSSE